MCVCPVKRAKAVYNISYTQLLSNLEVTPRFELGNEGFADPCRIILRIVEKEELYRKDHPSDRAFQASVASYIEFYNTKRPHCTLKNLTPCQAEENFNKNAK